jgi:hypothetical protein
MARRMPLRLTKLISGGQTGVDRAALDVALELGLLCGGYCPKGRRAEDGPLAARYPLQETASRDYAQRTEWNVRESDGTLVLTRGPADRGTALTLALAQRLGRPSLTVDLYAPREPSVAREWIERKRILVLNVAGPRESRCPGIYAAAVGLLRELLAEG